MPRSEGRAPRPFTTRLVIGTALTGLLAIPALAWWGPDLVDRYGYERIYSRTEPDGRRFQLERKRALWLPGPEMRCVVVASDGGREVHLTGACDESSTPEQRIQAALREDGPTER